MSFRAGWTTSMDVFNIRNSRQSEEDNEEDLKWAAIERLPTLDRIRKGMLNLVLDNGQVVHRQVDVTDLRLQDKKQLLESLLKFVDEDNEKFLHRLKERINR